MTLPTPSDLHVNRPLTNMSVAYMQSLLNFQADNLAPIMPSQKKSDMYFILNKEYWFSDIMKQRGIGAPAIRQGYGVSTGSFVCDLFALGKEIDDQIRANEDSPLNSDRTAMKFVTRAMLMNREKSFKSNFWATGKWGTDLTGNGSASNVSGASTFMQWSNAAATPIEDIAQMKLIMAKSTGFEPNVLAMGREVWEALRACPEILNRITGGSTSINPAHVTKDMVARLLEVEEIVVLSAVENTAGHGVTMTGSFIFGKQALLMYRDASVGIETPTACRTITWQQYAGNKNGTRILKWRDESVHSDIIEVESTYAHKIIATDLGMFLNSAVA
jgi:hypothetical protein